MHFLLYLTEAVAIESLGQLPPKSENLLSKHWVDLGFGFDYADSLFE